MTETRKILGSGGGGAGSTFVTKPDTLRSDDNFEILLGLGSGRWKGLVNGLQSLELNGVPLENADGSSNFEDVFMIFADGNPLENQIVTFQLGGGGNTETINTQLVNTTGTGTWVSGSVSTPNANYIDIRFLVNQLFYQDEKSLRENTANIEIEMRPSGAPDWINIFSGNNTSSTAYDPNGYGFYDRDGTPLSIYLPRRMFNPSGVGFLGTASKTLDIRGKTSSAYVKELRVAVPNTGDYANKTWEVRVRLNNRDTVDTDDIQERRNIVLETIAAVITEDLGDDPEWDGLVWAQIQGKASDQFNGFPEITGIFDTKICQVPPASIFDPDNRTYTNLTWDGSFEESFTTDPAWQIKEFVEDPIHGVSGIYPGATLDKWDALEASKYFSEPVPDGRGGTHPRFSMNLTISESKEIDEMMQYLAGAVNSYTEDVGGGRWRFKVDKPEDPVMLFTEDNVFTEFQYGHSDIDTRFNDWRGTFLDESLDYETNTVRVFDQEDIDKNGTRFTEVALIGCTHPQEALRRLMFRLRVSLNEFRSISFETNRIGRLINPLDTILVADGSLNPNHLVKSTSRLESHNGTTVILKRPLRLEIGVAYKIKFSTTDGVVERNIMNDSSSRGDVTTIQIDSALPPGVMAESAVALDAADLAALPVTYRVISVDRSEDDEDRYSISAVQVDSGKWNAMDNVSQADIYAQESSINIDSPTIPATGMFNVVQYVTDAQHKRVLQINWDRPAGNFLDGYRVQHRLNDGPWQLVNSKLTDSLFELQNPEDGTYDFKIEALDRRGVQSNPLVGRYTLDSNVDVTPPAHERGSLLDRPIEGPYAGYRFTVTDQSPVVTQVWDQVEKTWTNETNLVTQGSDIGVENGATVGMTAAEASKVTVIEQDVVNLFTIQTNLESSIGDLVSVFGDTESSAINAALAEAALENAVIAQGLVDQALAQTIDEKEAAEGFASIAGDHAGVAFARANEAGTEAGAARADRILAQTARGETSIFRDEAVIARDAAEGAANTATVQAGLSSGFRDQSQSFSNISSQQATIATAGATSATNTLGQISTLVGQAGASLQATLNAEQRTITARDRAETAQVASASSAFQANTSNNDARLTVVETLPSTFDQDGKYFSGGPLGDPKTRPNLSLAGVITYPTVVGVGKVLQFAAQPNALYDAATTGALSLQPDRVYRIRVIARTLSGTRNLTIGARPIKADYTDAFTPITTKTAALNTEWQTVEVIATHTQLTVNGGAFLRGTIRVQASTISHTVQIRLLELRDITSEHNASVSAQATIGAEQRTLATEDRVETLEISSASSSLQSQGFRDEARRLTGNKQPITFENTSAFFSGIDGTNGFYNRGEFVNDPTHGPVFQHTADVAANQFAGIAPRQRLPNYLGKKFKVNALGRRLSGSTGNQYQFRLIGMNRPYLPVEGPNEARTSFQLLTVGGASSSTPEVISTEITSTSSAPFVELNLLVFSGEGSREQILSLELLDNDAVSQTQISAQATIDAEVRTLATEDRVETLESSVSQSRLAVEAALPPIQASVAVTQATVATLQGAAVTYDVIAEATGSSPARIGLRTGINGSRADTVGERITLYNFENGEEFEVARFENGVAYFNQALIRRLNVFPRADSQFGLPVQLATFTLLGSDGQTIQYRNGLSMGARAQKITPNITGLPALPAGQSYDIRAVNDTPTGFTARAKVIGAATTQTQMATGGVNAGNVTPRWQMEKPTAADASDGNYQFKFNVTLPRTQVNQEPQGGGVIFYDATYQGTVDVYVANSTATGWVLVKTINISETRFSTSGLPATSLSVNVTDTINIGQVIGQRAAREFGVHATSASTTINSFTEVQYNTRSAASETPVTQLISWEITPPSSN